MRTALTAMVLIVGTALAWAADWPSDMPARIKQSLHPAVIEASWGSEGRSLWLFVADNGQARDGLAEAACGAMTYYNDVPKGERLIVRVWDIAKASDGRTGALLGKADCRL